MRQPIPARRLRLAAAIPLAGLVAMALLLAAPANQARAADGLRIVATTRYDVQPERGRILVTIDAVATALTPDTSAGRTYYSGITLGIPRGAQRVTASSGGQALRAVTDARQSRVSITFGRNIFFQQRYGYRISFDLVDGGGAADRDVRVSHSLVAFPVWAFGSEGSVGSRVQVTVPKGFQPSVEGGPLSSSQSADGVSTLSSGSLSDPLSFFAYVSADRPGAFTSTPLTFSVGAAKATVVVRAWDDDAAWGQRMAKLLSSGLPALHDLIGLDYPVTRTLQVEEAATSRLGEYAGIYNDTDQSITVRYDADSYVGLHEAAHIWFNHSLFRDRWINEAWAEFYGVQAGKKIGAAGETFHLSPALMNSKVALNDWGAVGVENLAVEDYAYAATANLANLIFKRTDLASLRRVWQAAGAGELAYQPAQAGAKPEIGRAVTQASWQQLLDLLEERTGADYDDLWISWVVDDDQRPLLERRQRARTSYEAVIRDAADWELPASIRYEMSSWQFDEASGQLTTSRFVLSKRDRIDEAAAALRLTPPSTLRAAFEGTSGMQSAAAEATAELQTLDALDQATQALTGQPSAVEWIGLLGSEPALDLDAARRSFESGDLTAADKDAAAARAARDGARDLGRQRVAIGGAGLLVLDGAAMGGLAVRRRRRRRAVETTLSVDQAA